MAELIPVPPSRIAEKWGRTWFRIFMFAYRSRGRRTREKQNPRYAERFADKWVTDRLSFYGYGDRVAETLRFVREIRFGRYPPEEYVDSEVLKFAEEEGLIPFLFPGKAGLERDKGD